MIFPALLLTLDEYSSSIDVQRTDSMMQSRTVSAAPVAA